MSFILVRKFLRDARPALIVVCLLLFVFAAFWVKITQRVTTQIVPVARKISTMLPFEDPKVLETVFVRGPSKVSQAALGWGDMNFDRPNDFLAIGLLHPVVLVMCVVWGVGRAAGAIAGELDRGTMELLMSQPVPRNRLILAHFLTDCVVLPIICLSFFAGTQFGLWAVGDFTPDYSMLDDLADDVSKRMAPTVGEEVAERAVERLRRERDMTPLEVSGRGELLGLANTLALMFAISGMTLALSSIGRSRWKVIGYAVLVIVVMFVANTIGQLWEPAGFVRPLTLFHYYQPQKAMIDGDWTVDLGKVWNLGRPVLVPAVGVLLAVGAL